MKKFCEKAKQFFEDHKVMIICGAIAGGSLALYSRSFDYGYNCRIDFEKACDAQTGSNIIKTLEHYSES